MDRLGTFEDAKDKVLAEIKRCLATVRSLATQPFNSPNEGVGILDRLRKETYEDLNQIQHEHLIVRAAEWLISASICPRTTQWYWNPRQTGDHQEPDLRGIHNKEIVVSAEITTSDSPKGVIDTRMRHTLEKLAHMEGGKYYFVRTDSMRTRANTKILKRRLAIQVVKIDV